MRNTGCTPRDGIDVSLMDGVAREKLIIIWPSQLAAVLRASVGNHCQCSA